MIFTKNVLDGKIKEALEDALGSLCYESCVTEGPEFKV